MNTELSEPKVTLGQAIRDARKSAKLSQEGLARKAVISVRTVRLIEKDIGDPRESTIQAICDALEMPVIVLRCMTSSNAERRKIADQLSVYHEQR